MSATIPFGQRPRYRCHGEWMYPNNNSTGWRCRIKTRARNNIIESKTGYYLKRRRRELGAQRTRVETALADLEAQLARLWKDVTS